MNNMILSRKRGFTLIEMIIVISIMLIIMGIAIPVTIGQINKAYERKYLVEAKVIENAVEMYNLEQNKSLIWKSDDLEKVRYNLIDERKKYITSWPPKLMIIENGVKITISEENLKEHRLNSIFKFINESEKKYY